MSNISDAVAFEDMSWHDELKGMFNMIKIRRIGCNSEHSDNFAIDRPDGYDCFMLILFKSDAYVYLDGTRVSAQKGDMIMFSPGYAQHYGAVGGFYSDDWMQLEIDKCVLSMIDPPVNKLLTSAMPEQAMSLFRTASDIFYLNTGYETQLISHLVTSLIYLFKAGSETASQPRCEEALLRLRERVYNLPQHPWTVEGMAQELHISCGYLQFIYKKTFGISCIRDVIESRIRYAQELLHDRKLSVKEISYTAGYRNEAHFTRQFRKFTGMSPTEYRAGLTDKTEIISGLSRSRRDTISADAS